LRRRGLTGYGAVVIGALAMLIVGLPIGLLGVTVAIFIRGVMMSFFSLIWVNTLQEIVPRDKLGRVSSIDDLGSFALMPVGFAVSGWATDLVGASSVFVIGGALSAIIAALALLHPAIRNLD
jgi:MFS family permease